jgi:RNA polymerase sigma factor (sigma-70 family)
VNLEQAWHDGLSVHDIARALQATPKQVAVAISEMIASGELPKRKGGLFGNKRPIEDNPLLGDRRTYIVDNIRLAYDLANKKRKKCEARHLDFEDLEQAAVLGLIEAYNTYCIVHQNFSTHAYYMVLKNITTFFRQNFTTFRLPEHLQQTRIKIVQANLVEEKPEAIAAKLNIRLSWVRKALECIKTQQAQSLDAPMDEENLTLGSSIPKTCDFTPVIVREFFDSVGEGKERHLLQLLCDGYRPKNAASVLGISANNAYKVTKRLQQKWEQYAEVT